MIEVDGDVSGRRNLENLERLATSRIQSALNSNSMRNKSDNVTHTATGHKNKVFSESCRNLSTCVEAFETSGCSALYE